MSGRHLIAAGYLNLPAAHKLALLKYADSANVKTRIAIPGLDALMVWVGTSRARTLEIQADLIEAGLLMQVGAGHRGRRASFKVFPEAGDERDSLAARRGEECPGADKFAGVPAIPDADELEVRAATRPKRAPRGGKKKPADEGTAVVEPSASDSKGSEESDASQPVRVRSVGPMTREKGSEEIAIGSEDSCIGSDASDPFSTSLQNKPSLSQAADAAWGSDEASDALFDVDAPEPPEKAPTQLLVGAYVDAVEASGGIATKSMCGAIGKHVKRLIRDDHIDLPVLLVAVQRAGTARAREVDRFLGDAKQTFTGSDTGRRAMFDAWQRIAEQHPIQRQIGA